MTDPQEQEQDEAAAWVARMDSEEDWSPARQQELQRWLAENPNGQGLLLRAQALWLSLDQSATGEIPRIPVRSTSLPRRALLGGSLAAVAASAAGIFFLPNGSRRIYGTGLGEIRQVPLDDGSLATINTASKIEVRFKPDVRLVNLEAGEAWFKVAKNPAWPFLVQAGDVWVRAVGTAFSVRRNPQGAEVIVTEGVVQTWTDADSSRKLLINRGGRALVSDDQLVQLALDPAKADRDLAWREGRIELVDETLADAISEFNRYNRRKIVLDDDDVAGEQVDGVFSANDPESFALAVHSLLDVPVDMSDPHTIRIG